MNAESRDLSMSDLAALEHFVKLAKRGSRPAGSGGEKRAWNLAVALCADVPGMDGLAVDGAAIFLRIAAMRVSYAESLIKPGA